MKVTRRRLMILSAAGVAGAAQALDADGDGGTLYGGTMALSEAFKVAEGLWIGPDSAKTEVPADSGHVYMASDTDVDYYGDGGSWVLRSIGSPENRPDANLGAASIEVLNRKRHADVLAASGAGTEADPYVVTDDIFDGSAVVKFPGGPDDNGVWYETEQLTVPSSIDFEKTNIVIEGPGPHHTPLKLADNAGLGNSSVSDGIIQLPNVDGNWITIRNMTIFGNKANNSGGIGIAAPSGIIDITIENCVIRRCADRSIRFDGSKSGCRFVNNWFEGSDGRGVEIGSGTRLKISDNHFVGSDRYGLTCNIDESQLHGNTYWSNGETGLRLLGDDNVLSTEEFQHTGTDEALVLAGNDNVGSAIRAIGSSADVLISGNGNELSGKIDGDLTLTGDNNDTTGLTVGGSTTDSGTGNST